MGYIYKITNKINGKNYIGQTTMNLKDRLTCHKSPSANMVISKAIKKYGWNNFSNTPIEDL